MASTAKREPHKSCEAGADRMRRPNGAAEPPSSPELLPYMLTSPGPLQLLFSFRPEFFLIRGSLCVPHLLFSPRIRERGALAAQLSLYCWGPGQR